MKNFKFLLCLGIFSLVACTERGSGDVDELAVGPDAFSESHVVTLKGGLWHNRGDASAKVRLLELDKNFAQTGLVATGKVDSTGHYTVTAENFESNYALLDVSGNFSLYCGGKKGEENLSVIVDLKKDSVVDVDFHVHAVSARAKWLVLNNDEDFASAWKQAENEWRKLMVLPQDGKSLKTIDLDDKDLWTKRLTVEMIVEHLMFVTYEEFPTAQKEFTDGFAEYGSSAKNNVIAAIAMEIVAIIRDGGLPDCKADFPYSEVAKEHYLDALWHSLLSVPECSSQNDGEAYPFFMGEPTIAQSYIRTSTGVLPYYKCDSSAWRDVTPTEYLDITDSMAGDGQRKTFMKTLYVYDDSTGWRKVTDVEKVLNMPCTHKNVGTYYRGARCMTGTGDWEDMSYIEADLYGQECSEDSVFLKGSISLSEYVCLSGEPHPITEMDKAVGKICNAENKGDSVKMGYTYFVCDSTWKWSVCDSAVCSFVDSRDDKTYRFVGVGNQRWMAQNLRYTSKHDYGFYTWFEAMNVPENTDFDSLKITLPHRGVCPEGWHLPSKAEWDTLFAFVEKYEKTTTLAKSLFIDIWVYEGIYNTFGFNVYPSGRIDLSGKNKKDGFEAYFWYAVEKVEDNAFPFYYLVNSKDDVQSGRFSDPNWGLNVRCVADEEGN